MLLSKRHSPKGVDRKRLVRAVCRINDCSESAAVALLRRAWPIVINPDLSEGDATLGQFELVCCEAISAVVRSEVALQAGREYLEELLRKISRSPEFRPTQVCIEGVPMTEAGQRFADQFLGLNLAILKRSGFPRRFTMLAKKARIMKHWAARIEAQVRDETAEPS